MKSKDMVIGIYKITNKINGKVYIGQSNNIFRRWMEYQRNLIYGIHHSSKLQKEWNEYGFTAFTFEVLEECKKDELDAYELKYITEYDSILNGYNHKNATNGEVIYKDSDILNTKGVKFVVDFDELSKILNKYDIVRFLYLYFKCTTINGNFYKDLNINKNSELIKYLGFSPREGERLLKEIENTKVIKIDYKQRKIICPYVYITYEFKQCFNGKLILYRDKYFELYNNTTECNIYRLLLLYNFSKETCNKIHYKNVKDIFNTKTNYSKMIKALKDDKYIKINKIIKIKEDMLYLNSSIGHGLSLLKYKFEYDKLY